MSTCTILLRHMIRGAVKHLNTVLILSPFAAISKHEMFGSGI